MTSRARKYATTLVFGTLFSGLIGASCSTVSETSSGDGGAGGGDSSGSESAAETTATSAETSSSGSAGSCSVMAEDACGQCMADSCCEAYEACEAEPDCWSCVTGTDGDTCGQSPAIHELQTAFLECYGGPCNADCIGAAGECGEAAEVFDESCGSCLENNCCDQLGACYGHEGCWVDCVTQHNSAGCHEPEAHALFYALGDCANSACSSECSAQPEIEPACENVPEVAPSDGSCIDEGAACNPITNEGCSEDGYACDRGQQAPFQCYEPPNTQGLCEACGSSDGYCSPGHTCVAGVCVKFCCDQGDCGDGNSCDTELVDRVGLCVVAE